ncbi:DUF4267 domain-containing protein [Nocardioides rubriscoriae]|uniref:DUF4267 domain-containing protein n=1 Tax=Nocardioides rubriscoriae TaxID=642762 RepID=UPI0011E03FF4|nr:DUF4267 domain-containing protein [Nocardioides rubriscoriae]
MSYALSRLMSTATASYAGFCFVRPEHLGEAMGADKHEQPGFDRLAEVFGVRDLAISAFGMLGRSDRTVTTAMWIRICCDVGDGVVLARRADDDQTRAKVLAATLTWGTLNLLALRADKRRARKVAAAKEVASAARSVAGTVVDKIG